MPAPKQPTVELIASTVVNSARMQEILKLRDPVKARVIKPGTCSSGFLDFSLADWFELTFIIYDYDYAAQTGLHVFQLAKEVTLLKGSLRDICIYLTANKDKPLAKAIRQTLLGTEVGDYVIKHSR